MKARLFDVGLRAVLCRRLRSAQPYIRKRIQNRHRSLFWHRCCDAAALDLVYGVGTVDSSYTSPVAVSVTRHKCLLLNVSTRMAQELLAVKFDLAVEN